MTNMTIEGLATVRSSFHQRHKATAFQILHLILSADLTDQLQFLGGSWTNWRHHSSAFAQLSEQSRRNLSSRSRNQNGIEWSILCPTFAAITDPDLHVAISQSKQRTFRQGRKSRVPLHRIDFCAEQRQQSRNVARTCADFEDTVT